jgi:acetyltransferase-like isoleucine patch superfamily enzyme
MSTRNMFDRDTDPKLREQILTYAISQSMTDRERAKLLGLPDGCRIRENAKIISPENLICGKNVWIGEGTVLDASGGLEIGDNTQFGLYTLVFSHDSVFQALAGETGTSRKKIMRKPVCIGSNCFIGGLSIILPGVTIGNRAIVRPMSLIGKDVPDRKVTLGDYGDRIVDLEQRMELVERKLKEIDDRDR